tara:strand:+ start:220 stop:459 length:240 start_codon:yes stop_codon:yes gene_type:complete
MGGIIIRKTLPLLEDFKSTFFTYISLSSPHLGYLKNSSTHINFGMWLFKKLKKIESFNQLSTTDEKDFKETFLYKLSKE